MPNSSMSFAPAPAPHSSAREGNHADQPLSFNSVGRRLLRAPAAKAHLIFPRIVIYSPDQVEHRIYRRCSADQPNACRPRDSSAQIPANSTCAALPETAVRCAMKHAERQRRERHHTIATLDRAAQFADKTAQHKRTSQCIQNAGCAVVYASQPLRIERADQTPLPCWT